MLFALGMLVAVESMAPAEARAKFLFLDVTAFSETNAFGIGFTTSWAWLAVSAVIGSIAFLLGARCWRIGNRVQAQGPRRRRTATR